jgi:tetratricopeptide (TPR) repeat protein
MKQIVALGFCVFCFLTSFSQQDAKKIYASAKEFLRQGDIENAEIFLRDGLKIEPYNYVMLKDLAFVDYLKKDYKASIEICNNIIERPDVDEQAFQILGNNYKATEQLKECTKTYRTGLSKFPGSGPLYNELGELYAMDKNLPAAIEQWEKGIQMAPSYSSNYYNATNYYARNNNYFKVFIYGEIFINIESYTTRTADIKAFLFEAYKKLYAEGDLLVTAEKYKNDFALAVLETMNKSKNIAADGITPENITAIRTRFILDWFASDNQQKFPFHLFAHQQFLLREGLFEAYTQWIFGLAENPAAYQSWANTHLKEAGSFKQYQQGKIYKVPSKQFYF